MKKLKKLLMLSVSVVLFNNLLCAKVELPSIFSDNMMLQQKTSVKIWGTSDKHNNITVETGWNGKQYKASIKADGKWTLFLETPKFGGPYIITINDGDILKIKNILIGDIWVCSGQSNMEMPLKGWGKINNYEAEIKNANYPEIRLLQVEHVTSNHPLSDAKIQGNKGWQICSPSTIPEFSATAYFFARTIYQKTKIPIGLIHSSWGGTIAEAWTSATSLLKTADFKGKVAEIENSNDDELKKEYNKKFDAWTNIALQKDSGFRNGFPQWINIDVDDAGWSKMNLPDFFENSALEDFDGIVWFREIIDIPESMAGKDLVLNLGSIDDNDITYFNGEKIGETIGYNMPRKYNIPGKRVKAGKNIIAVRVFDSGGGGGLYDKDSPFNITDGIQDISLRGVWKYKVGLDFSYLPPNPKPIDQPNRPTVLYNGMINSFIPYKIKGVIWYQGESNAGRPIQYRWLFPTLIKDWRQKWNIGNFPFYFVQLAAYMQKDEQPPQKSDWAMLREAQYKTLSLPATGMATAIDIGDTKDVHPKNKQEVGRRLALIALHNDYRFTNEYSGPQFVSKQTKGNEVILTFSHSLGLHFKGDKLTGFAVAGNDKKFYWADASIENNKVIVSNDIVKNPVSVRYAWGNNPDVNLYNSSDLPAVPFRTDNWDN